MLPITISNRVDEYQFQYVVERKEADPCCFGSRINRDTAPIGKGLSSFQRRDTSENYPHIGPGYYHAETYNTAFDKTLNKVRSVKGVGVVASSNPRFKTGIVMRVPSPTRYNLGSIWDKREEGKAPFGTNTKRMVVKERNLPGPGTYKFGQQKCRRTRFAYNLGKPTIIPATETLCVSRPADVCIKCESICPGDYWHKNYSIFLCQLCWNEEKSTATIYNNKELQSFKKLRNCSFVHSHERTTAAIRLHPQKYVNKRLQLENYLNLYIRCS